MKIRNRRARYACGHSLVVTFPTLEKERQVQAELARLKTVPCPHCYADTEFRWDCEICGEQFTGTFASIHVNEQLLSHFAKRHPEEFKAAFPLEEIN